MFTGPSLATSISVGFVAVLHATLDGEHHFLLDVEEPDLHLTLELDSFGEGAHFLLTRVHFEDFTLGDVQVDQVIEERLQVQHDDFLDLVGVGQNVEQLVIRQEVEAREIRTLTLHVLLQGLGNLVKQFVVLLQLRNQEGTILDDLQALCRFLSLGHQVLEEFIDLLEFLVSRTEIFPNIGSLEDILQIDPLLLHTDPLLNSI